MSLSNLIYEFSEILVDLREAVLQVARHFINVDPKLNNIVLIADYTMESHAKDHDNYVNVSRTRKRRAKALLGTNIFSIVTYYNDITSMMIKIKNLIKLNRQSVEECCSAQIYNVNLVTDFERHDDDELGFRKNDIITIISQKDEHCWVGELNGLRGNILNERNLTVLFEMPTFS